KGNLIGGDFLDCKSEQISHVNYIIMNPPFSKDMEHILHAWEIAPEGCQIVSLCNTETLSNTFSRGRRSLKYVVESNGVSESLGNVFQDAERKTGVDVSMVTLFKPIVSENYNFEGFLSEEEENDPQGNGIMPYNEIRDIVQRY